MSDLHKQWQNFAAKQSAHKSYVDGWEKKIGSFLEYKVSAPAAATSDVLKGLPFGVKDNIAVRDYKITCGSKLLKDVVSPYTATAVARLQAAGAIVVGKNNLDEFGMGSSTDNSALKVTNNPWDVTRVSGGSSGGSAAAVAAGLVPFALGTDTGGSVRQPAAFCGVFGLKPTYGTVPRFGLTAYASSLEVIGVCAKNVDITEKVFHVMKGKDENDQTSLDHTPGPYKEVKTIAVLKGLTDLSPEVKASYDKTLATLTKLGYKLVEVELPTLEYAVPAYYTIAMAEASANLARFNGIRYGQRPDYAENPEDLIRKARSNGFGDEVKIRIMLGTYVLRSGFQDQYYVRAQKVRTAIRNDFDKVFAGADVLLMPSFPTTAFAHGDKNMTSFQQKLADKFTVSANLAGIPGLSFPSSVENGLPVGMQLLGPVFEEGRLFEVARKFEETFPSPDCPGYSMDWSK